ncbi:DUF3492 domain-containing protein [Streptomyces sp. JJ66]|uniref:glycosyltransferase n=1 Tax=Streptomyces sp. JJ66 TaxID=2803843 RepID=UPI001C591B97|nr:glycosyltransferase [Streptomyces sp. JJ66]MBW1602974.1 DUF3492 domain-containing protein [Streptomyces sp. JJ66]
MRAALLTEGGYPYAKGESVLWCDRLVHGLRGHEFEVYALSRGPHQEAAGYRPLPPQVRRVHTAPLWGPPPPGGRERRAYGRRERARFAEHFADLAAACCADPAVESGTGDAGGAGLADRFASGLYGLADLAADHGRLPLALGSERAVRLLEAACRAPGALRTARVATVTDLLAVTERLERALRPLSLGWYGDGRHGAADGAPGADAGLGLAAVDLCHAVGAGPSVLPALLARRRFGTPLLLTEYGVRVREHYLTGAVRAVAPGAAAAPVRALLAAFQTRLAREAYRQAGIITPGNTHARRWQERCGADRERLRTVYPGMDARPFTPVPEDPGAPDPDPLLVWTGRLEPGKDLVALLHAFAEVRRAVPRARLLIVGTGSVGTGSVGTGSVGTGSVGSGPDRAGSGYAAHCRALTAQLFPDEAADRRSMGRNPVTFTEVGGPDVPRLADAYAAATVVVLSSVIEGFPVSLVEAMFSGRATVSTDAGAVCEVIGGTGLVVPPRNPRALAESCLALLRDPARRARLAAAARARALELFTVEQNVRAFHSGYLELIARRREADAVGDAAPPFARTAEAHVPGRWASGRWTPSRVPPERPGQTAATPSWAHTAPAGVGAATGSVAGSVAGSAAGEDAR